MASRACSRLNKELLQLHANADHGIYVAAGCGLLTVHALLVGPPDTPYALGLFDLALVFPADYPAQPPRCVFGTTNHGRARFGPNLYASGKVCLSILGTWAGHADEQWSQAHGIASILISIRSVLSDNPYNNEPGFEAGRRSSDAQRRCYAAKIRHETLRISVCIKLEAVLSLDPLTGEKTAPHDARVPGVFDDLSKSQFLWYCDRYIEMCSSERKAHIDGKLFEKALFETADNGMTGSFNYSSLLRRLAHIRTAIDSETRDWARQGMIAAQTQSGPAENLRLQFEQVRQWTADSSCMVALELEDDNPFVWIVNILGLPMTPFDEGHWLIKISLSPDFPNDQPRIRFLTPFFHPNVTVDGVPFYRIQKQDSMQAHVNAIIAFFDLDNIITDPSCTLNTDAARLWCGTELQKKEYKRKTRQMVLKSAE